MAPEPDPNSHRPVTLERRPSCCQQRAAVYPFRDSPLRRYRLRSLDGGYRSHPAPMGQYNRVGRAETPSAG